MTDSSNINYWQRVDITMASRTDGTTTRTVKLINRVQIADVDDFYFPLLLGVNGIGVGMRSYIPGSDGGSIDIDDSYGSFGYERKFSDLLQRYSIHEQYVEVFFAKNTIADEEASSWTSIFLAKVKSWKSTVQNDRQVLTIQYQSNSFQRKRVGQTITHSGVFASTPVENIGVRIPVAIGDSPEVNPILIDALGSTNPRFAYATDFYDEYTVGSIISIYARRPAGDFVAVTSASSGSGHLVFTAHSGAANTTEGTSVSSSEYGRPIDGAFGYVVTGGRILCRGTRGAGAGTTSLFVSLWGSNNTGTNQGPQFLLGTAEVDKSQYAAEWTGGIDFYIDFTFQEAIVLSYPKLFISFRESSAVLNDSTPYRYDNTHTNNVFFRDATVPGNEAWVYAGVQVLHQQKFELYGVAFEDETPSPSDVDSEGYICRRVELSQRASSHNQEDVDLSVLPFVLVVAGITDDGSGTITGTPSAPINLPHHVLELLSLKWSPSLLTWTAIGSVWDFSVFSSSHSLMANTSSIYYRKLQGRLNPNQSLEVLLEDLCRNSAVRIGLTNDGKFAVWGWGYSYVGAEVATYTQENCTVLNIVESDYTFVVNHVRLRHTPILRTITSQNRYFFERIQPYSEQVEWYLGSSALATALIGESVDLYGERLLDQDQFDYVGKESVGELLARFFLTNYNRPPITVTIEVPYVGSESVKLLDVVFIKHPAIHAYFGTSPNALLPQYNGAPLDVAGGFTYSRADLFRAIVESKRILLNDSDGPILSLGLRLLLNPGADPT